MDDESTSAIEILVSVEIDANAPPDLDWFANSSPARSREGRLNRLLRRFGLRLMRTSTVDPEQERRAEWGRFATEDHHHVYGRPWFVGRDYCDLLLSRGLRPEDKLLDFGCGSMRAGIWTAAYLDEGSYFGIDSHRASLDIALNYEVPLHGLEHKQPQLLHSTEFRIDLLDTVFDFVFCASVFRHLSPEERPRALRAIRESCRIGSSLVVQTNDLDPEDPQLSALGFHHVESFVWRSKFVGESRWTEYRVE